MIEAKKFKAYDFIEFDSDEEALCEIRKHPFGLFLIYLTGILVSAVIMFVGIFSSLWLENNQDQLINGSSYNWVVLVVAIVLSALALLASAVYAYIFGNNAILVTSEKVAQVLYKSLFDRKVSQLNISDVQDVTVSQVGIFARLLNYGTLVIETAGEQQNYTFTFTPNPHHFAKEIIAAHEKNVGLFGN